MTLQEISSLVVKIDKELHQQIKSVCALNDLSIKEYITSLVKEDMRKRKEKNNKD